MSKEPTLTEQTKKIFKETVNIYRGDLNTILKNPLPLILVGAAMILLWLVITWLM